MSKDGCHICHVVGQSSGHGQYFRMPSTITMRTPESFKYFDEVALSSKKGLTGQSPFSLLNSFSGPFFFALDEMHGICHSIAKQVWGLVCGKYGKDHPLSLSLAAQKEIGTAMVSTRRSIPTSFHGAWINVATRSGYFRAVDWADFILFVIPTLVAERVCDQAARKALLDLAYYCEYSAFYSGVLPISTGTKADLVTCAQTCYLQVVPRKLYFKLCFFAVIQSVSMLKVNNQGLRRMCIVELSLGE
ncbi:hypothetical protein PHYBLDRAFT_165367 [Phycomyces blakesleeanus NRRL 1555(-)]|uniref:Uncharacterized protein n=1 Tax=Phycomyces blakesleeanus (strain ATCC 8743b / DSM 1359 / FGSC 10004 / NBRC 33097 / NRRL 1555) TaxID=763407 RepID=A0A167NY51_PHYB8|nr:hypothetical protein PHYBLDRAFT_165367 [Phycomyces blakesleeanus NRRL 1555(-)]OAD76864.1 hypothetical protein PHYBLDRAFT_165367 [Phycomyces blakesleeanus NRRL 1555(-)]|eukprot:XP_018294904.1 hypothetical protein PHYBLDRAFT_165367 [Phycomyces blakesleeanus NRRL 1555(-)]